MSAPQKNWISRPYPHDMLAVAMSAPTAAINVGATTIPLNPCAASPFAGTSGAPLSMKNAQATHAAKATIAITMSHVASPRRTRTTDIGPLSAPPQAMATVHNTSSPPTSAITAWNGAIRQALLPCSQTSVSPSPVASRTASTASVISTNANTAARWVRSAASAVRGRCQKPRQPSRAGFGGPEASPSGVAPAELPALDAVVSAPSFPEASTCELSGERFPFWRCRQSDVDTGVPVGRRVEDRVGGAGISSSSEVSG